VASGVGIACPFFKVSKRATQYVGYPKERKDHMRTRFESEIEEPIQVRCIKRCKKQEDMYHIVPK
jgi:hypothetical protein